MPSRKSPAKGKKADNPEARWTNVLLEEMRAQNRTTIEAVQAQGSLLNRRIDEMHQEFSGKFLVLEIAVRQNSEDIRQNTEEIRKNGEDIRGLKVAVEELTDRLDTLDERVMRVEKRAPTA